MNLNYDKYTSLKNSPMENDVMEFSTDDSGVVLFQIYNIFHDRVMWRVWYRDLDGNGTLADGYFSTFLQAMKFARSEGIYE